jgi:hypothetical protein
MTSPQPKTTTGFVAVVLDNPLILNDDDDVDDDSAKECATSYDDDVTNKKIVKIFKNSLVIVQQLPFIVKFFFRVITAEDCTRVGGGCQW